MQVLREVKIPLPHPTLLDCVQRHRRFQSLWETDWKSFCVQHKKWPKGCITTMATSVDARVRDQIDRGSDIYKK
jgi:hypothetical protein